MVYNPTTFYDHNLLNHKHAAYLQSYRRIDWTDIIEKLKNTEGSSVTTNHSRWDTSNNNYNEIEKLWADANFNPNSIKWTNYYPEKHFSQELIIDISSYLRLEGVHRSWISRVDPGFFAPPHWDIDDHEDEYLKKGIKRYSIFMNDPTIGHLFILEDEYYFNMPRGSIIHWKNHRSWHTGVNGGLTPKFMLHILGY